ncbi:efflux RND transporter periplasmic adaptor subunit [Microbulbifer halophilus]|uniref:Efflux RND transporter periplasmic adaptor subunit n=1 Tax=Microbulbifer halophilus TaxID=453963 RepID=A0ABW5ECT0_9GAMM|nr:efflux RND transporter periplasmic adaptor subunit [Microbulbifer halophilus]MCW8125960.1 efflux RND transporter periplasmic adaptor subunit [Microbulbifer halophilus]
MKSTTANKYLLGGLLLLAALLISWWTLKSEQATETAAEFIEAGPFRIAVSIDPRKPRAGDNSIRIEVRDREDRPIENAQVRAVAEMPAMGAMPAMRAPAEIAETAPGVYEGEFELSMDGAWPLAVDVSTAPDKHVDLVFDMTTSRAGLRLKSAPGAGDTAYYTCSMHPSVESAEPGTCPICGMDLQAVSREELESGTIVVDAGRRQAIGIDTGRVKKENFSLPLRLQGQVTYDETRLRDISLRFSGWIGDLEADFEGKRIARGDVLFTVYSPELLALQDEYLQSRRRGGATEKAARRRLRRWGLSQRQVEWLGEQEKARDYMPIFAPASGTVIEKNIVAGSAFEKGQKLLRLADLSRVWVEAYAYENQLPLLEQGMSAQVRLTNLSGRPMLATLAQIDPFLNRDSRSARLRLALPNPDGRLRPGLFADIQLRAPLGKQLLVPRDAVLFSGDKRIVFRDLGRGRLQPIEVRTGYGDNDNIVIRAGLAEGDRIIASGVFLIAAESRLKSGVQQW